MKIHDLAKLTDVSARQIRYLISEGLCPPPTGGRKYAEYGDRHLDAIRQYRHYRNLGYPHIVIRSLREANAGFPFRIAPGITLVVSPELIGSGVSVNRLLDPSGKKRLQKVLSDAILEVLKPDAESADEEQGG